MPNRFLELQRLVGLMSLVGLVLRVGHGGVGRQLHGHLEGLRRDACELANWILVSALSEKTGVVVVVGRTC